MVLHGLSHYCTDPDFKYEEEGELCDRNLWYKSKHLSAGVGTFLSRLFVCKLSKVGLILGTEFDSIISTVQYSAA